MVIGDAQLGVNAGLGAERALALPLANGRNGPLHFFGEISATAPRPQGYVGSAGRALVWSLANGRERPLTFFLGVRGESAAASHGCNGSTVQIGGMTTEGAAKDTKTARSQLSKQERAFLLEGRSSCVRAYLFCLGISSDVVEDMAQT